MGSGFRLVDLFLVFGWNMSNFQSNSADVDKNSARKEIGLLIFYSTRLYPKTIVLQ